MSSICVPDRIKRDCFGFEIGRNAESVAALERKSGDGDLYDGRHVSPDRRSYPPLPVLPNVAIWQIRDRQ